MPSKSVIVIGKSKCHAISSTKALYACLIENFRNSKTLRLDIRTPYGDSEIKIIWGKLTKMAVLLTTKNTIRRDVYTVVRQYLRARDPSHDAD